MGVIHKLKQEVIDFILKSKKENPSISCRQLSKKATDKFQTTISKSSVNYILKNAKLSSSVGRRRGKIEKSFQIPAFKKQQISESLQDTGLMQVVGRTEEVSARDKENAVGQESLQKKQQEKAVDLVKREASLEVADNAEEQPKSRDTKVLRQESVLDRDAEEKREQLSDRFSPIFKGMGLIFFKAAEWDAPGKSFFRKMFSRIFSSSVDYDFDKEWHSLLFLTRLGVNTRDGFEKFQNYFFWPMDGIEDREKIQNCLSVLEKANIAKETLFEYESFKEQLFLDVSYFKLFLEDGSMLICDSQMRSFYETEPVNLPAWPFYKAVASLSKMFISNNDLLVSCFSANNNSSFEQAKHIISYLEKEQKNKINKISLFNSKNQQVASYSIVPEQKRSFILGLFNVETAAGSFVKTEDRSLRRPYYCKAADKLVYFSHEQTETTRTPAAANVSRAIFLYANKGEDAKVMLLTNLNGQRAEDVVEGFLSRFPDFDNFVVDKGFLRFSWEIDKKQVNNYGKFSQTKQEEANRLPQIKDLLNDYFSTNLLNCSIFFPFYKMPEDNIKNFFKMLCEIQGSFSKDEDSLVVRLDMRGHGESKNLFVFAARQVNNSNIRDPYGCKLRIEVL